MGATVIVNFRSVVHKGSGGTAPSVPDVCKTPAPPAPPVPIPYPNIAKSSDTDKGSKKVKMDGKPIMLKNSKFSKSMGDEAGTLKGIVSSASMGIAKFALYSFDVKVEGKNVPRLGDPMTNNGNGPNSATVAELQQTLIVAGFEIRPDEVKKICEAICECKDATTKGDSTGKVYLHKQGCVANQLSSGYPTYDETIENMLCEQPYNLTTNPPSLFLSRSGRTTMGGATAGAGLWSGMGQASHLGAGASCRPDIVLTHSSSQIAQGSNIRQVIEVKFKNDKLGDTQFDDYNSLNPDAPEPLVLEEEQCDCE